MLTGSHVVRLANRLHSAWAARAAPSPDPEAAWLTLEARLHGMARLCQRYRLAVEKRFRLAAPVVLRELSDRMVEVRDRLGRIAVEYAPTGFHAPDLGEWVREVRHLGDEFGDVEVRWGDAAVRVVTAPVTLRGVALGAFAIEFVWPRLATRAGSACFDVIALDPRPAAGRPDVVHPHVRDDGLCAGDAERPLERALRDGRLADAFLLVRSVLEAYNPHSPYVPLGEWDGFACGDCGGRGHPDDRSTCEACDADLCDGCVRGCETCHTTRCPGCLASCAVCAGGFCPECLASGDSGRSFCPSCRVPCARCPAVVPRDELTDPGRRCPACASEEEVDDEAIDSETVGGAGA